MRSHCTRSFELFALHVNISSTFHFYVTAFQKVILIFLFYLTVMLSISKTLFLLHKIEPVDWLPSGLLETFHQNEYRRPKEVIKWFFVFSKLLLLWVFGVNPQFGNDWTTLSKYKIDKTKSISKNYNSKRLWTQIYFTISTFNCSAEQLSNRPILGSTSE